MEKLTGKVQTVLGLIDANDLGITLPHEHLLLDMSIYFNAPPDVNERELAYAPVKMENLSWLRFHRLNNLENLKLQDEDVAIKEAKLFKKAGGSTIVELSNIGMHRDPPGLLRISRATGLNIIMGSGYYIGLSHPPELAAKTEEEVAKEIIKDIMVGYKDTGICAGIIGEIGCSAPLLENEQKVLRASAIAQKQTGAAINIHPGKRDYAVLEIIRILKSAGADLTRTIISHVSYSCFKMDTLYRLADEGCYLEIDNFGRPVVPFPFYIFERYQDAPSETQRIETVINLINKGYLDQILISVDNCLKQNLITYGGNGYIHILSNVVPWMKTKGISDKQISTIMVKNPKRVLAFAPVK